jgi:hypothetical protein
MSVVLMSSSDCVTFRNAGGSATSLIDYFLVSPILLGKVVSVKTVDNGVNFSDHLPLEIICSVDLGVTLGGSSRWNEHNNRNSSHNLKCAWRWDKAKLNLYYDLTYQYLTDIKCDTIMHKAVSAQKIRDEIEKLYAALVLALENAAFQSVPRKKANFYNQWRDEELDEAKRRSIFAHREWETNGKPHAGLLYDNKCKLKCAYKLLIKTKELTSNNNFSDELGDALIAKSNMQFWRSWNANFSRNKNIAEIEGCKDESSAA